MRMETNDEVICCQECDCVSLFFILSFRKKCIDFSKQYATKLNTHTQNNFPWIVGIPTRIFKDRRGRVLCADCIIIHFRDRAKILILLSLNCFIIHLAKMIWMRAACVCKNGTRSFTRLMNPMTPFAAQRSQPQQYDIFIYIKSNYAHEYKILSAMMMIWQREPREVEKNYDGS